MCVSSFWPSSFCRVTWVKSWPIEDNYKEVQWNREIEVIGRYWAGRAAKTGKIHQKNVAAMKTQLLKKSVQKNKEQKKQSKKSGQKNKEQKKQSKKAASRKALILAGVLGTTQHPWSVTVSPSPAYWVLAKTRISWHRLIIERKGNKYLKFTIFCETPKNVTKMFKDSFREICSWKEFVRKNINMCKRHRLCFMPE